MLFKAPPMGFGRHVQHHLIELGAGVKLVKQVRELVGLLDEDKKVTLTMAQRALLLRPLTTNPKAAMLTNEPPPPPVSSAAAEEQREEPRGKKGESASVASGGPSLGFLLALKKMLPTLELLFDATSPPQPPTNTQLKS